MRPSMDTPCAFCGRSCGSRGEWDHFPVPKRRGGKDVQALCVSCHDLKDRVILLNWPRAALADAQFELRACVESNLEEFERWESCLAIKSFPDGVWPSVVLLKMVGPSWDQLGYAGKALVAKMMQVADDRIELARKAGAA